MEAWLKCQYLKQQGDQVYDATVVRTLPTGFQVRLDANGIEGFVTSKSLNQKLSFDPVSMTLANGARRFHLDQAVQVKVAEIDPERRQIRFQLVESDSAGTEPA